MTQLPIPGPEAAAHSHALTDFIRGRIVEAGGWIPFAEYMSLALYAPGLGYYTAGARKFGAGGDFVTAPELTPIFGQAIAAQAAQVIETIGGGDILELGAGSGRLAVDMLLELERLDRLPVRYFILDVSADLCERQRHWSVETIPHLADRVVWLDTLPDHVLPASSSATKCWMPCLYICCTGNRERCGNGASPGRPAQVLSGRTGC